MQDYLDKEEVLKLKVDTAVSVEKSDKDTKPKFLTVRTAPSTGKMRPVIVSADFSEVDLDSHKKDVYFCHESSFDSLRKDKSLIEDGKFLKNFFYRYKLSDILKFAYTYRAELENYLRYINSFSSVKNENVQEI